MASSFDFGEDFVEKVEKVGDFTVTIQEKKPEVQKVGALVTFHDIGLNHTSFKEFFKNEYNVQFYDKFTVYHIDAPGQEIGAEKMAAEYQYPSLEKMAEMLGPVLEHFALTDIFGFGVGAGATVMIHLAMLFPKKFLGLILCDPAGKSAGFKEWGEEKLAAWSLQNKGFTSSTEKFLIWHLFGTKGKKKVNMELVDTYIKEITKNQNPHNLAQYVKAYMQRTDVMSEVADKLQANVLICTSAHSPYKEECNKFHSKLNSTKASIIDASETINIFVEDPGKCGEGMLLLMQGCGLVPTLRTRTASRGGPVHRTASMSED